MCTHPFAKKALTLHLARSEGHERYFSCNLMHGKVLASFYQHLIAEAPRKLHIAVDRETGNIVASELTASRARDATRVPALLTQIQAPLVSVAADSAYDKEAVYEAIEAHSPGRRTRVVIPPQRNATLSQNSNTAMQERDRHIRAIERHGRREWYKLPGYTKRSMVENAVYRYKAIIGPEMRARTLARQRVEHRIGCEILNKMAALGMPDTYCAG